MKLTNIAFESSTLVIKKVQNFNSNEIITHKATSRHIYENENSQAIFQVMLIKTT